MSKAKFTIDTCHVVMHQNRLEFYLSVGYKHYCEPGLREGLSSIIASTAANLSSASWLVNSITGILYTTSPVQGHELLL